VETVKTEEQTENPPVQDGQVNRRFLTSTIHNFAGQGFLLVLTFATAPYIVHHLGAELFGIVALVQTVAGFAGIVNLGIGRALTKYVSELYWKKDVQAINRLFQTAWATCVMSGVVGFVLLVGPRDTIGRLFFRGGSEVDNVIGFAIYIAAFGLFSSMLLEAISALPGGLQRFDILNKVNIVSGTARSLGSVAVLAMGYSVRSVLIINLSANVLAIVAFALVSKKLIRGLSLLPIFHLDAFRRLFVFSLPLFVSALSSLIIVRVDRFILAYFLPLSAVTFYTLPYTISEKAAVGVANITSVVYPFTSELHSMGSHDRVHELYLRSTKILTLITLPLCVILMAIPGPILLYWLGPEYAAQGAIALSLLGAATFLNAASGVATVTSLGVGRAWMPSFFAIAASVVNVIANFVLIPRYGINGAALGALLPQALVLPIFVYVVTHQLKFSSRELFSHAFLRPMICGFLQFLVLLVFRRYVDSVITLVMLGLASLAIYGLAALYGAITREERNFIFRLPAFGVNQR
jgi:O-antigen/teichoic acid export membrane protein